MSDWLRLIRGLISIIFDEWKAAPKKLIPTGDKRMMKSREQCRRESKGQGTGLFESESRRRIKWLSDLVRNLHATD